MDWVFLWVACAQAFEIEGMYRARIRKWGEKVERVTLDPAELNLHMGEAEIEDIHLPFKMRIFKDQIQGKAKAKKNSNGD